MADYTQPDVVNKRVRFYDGQYLQDQDFVDEQRYHLDRERRQNRLLSVTGVVSGLTVIPSGGYQVTVAKGTAVDPLGRQLVLALDLTLQLTRNFTNKQNVEVHLVYQESATDLAQKGLESARRWDESPKVVAALAQDGTVAVAPDSASRTWEGPTVLLARLAVDGNGTVTVDSTVASQAGLSVPGAVGIGIDNPEYRLTVSSEQEQLQLRRGENSTSGGSVRFLELLQADAATPQVPEVFTCIRFRHQNRYAHRLEVQSSGFHLKYASSGDEHADLFVRDVRMQNLYANYLDVTTDVAARDIRMRNLYANYLGVTTDVDARTIRASSLRVSAKQNHLQLRREKSEGEGGSQVFLHLFQDDDSPTHVPEVFPAIRFQHNNRFWYLLEAQSNGFHFKDLNAGYADLHARNLSVSSLAVGTEESPLAVRRSERSATGGSVPFLELLQADAATPQVPEVFPCIRFRHQNRYAHRLEVQPSGFRFKLDSAGEEHADVFARDLQVQNVSLQNLHAREDISARNMSIQDLRAQDISASSLAVDPDNGPLLVRRPEATEGGSVLFLELLQADAATPQVPEVFPGIRFRHQSRYAHRLEVQPSGFHFKLGSGGEEHMDLFARDLQVRNISLQNLYATEDISARNMSMQDLRARNISASDNVGIGTTDPENAGSWKRVVDIVGSVNAKLSVRSSQVNGLVTANDAGYLGFSDGMAVWTNTDHALSFGTNGTSRMIIDKDGHAGIGTPIPENAEEWDRVVDVQGPKNAKLSVRATWVDGRVMANDGDFSGWPAGMVVGTKSKHSLSFTTDKSARLIITDAGDVVIKKNVWIEGKLNYFTKVDSGDYDTRKDAANNPEWRQVRVDEHSFVKITRAPDAGFPSDGRLKTALRPIRNALSKISRLEGTYFKWGESGLEYLTRDVAQSVSAGPGATEEENQRLVERERCKGVQALSGEFMGLVAQDVEAVVPEVVYEDSDGYKKIRYAHLTALLIEALKEQHVAIEELRARLVTLEPTTT